MRSRSVFCIVVVLFFVLTFCGSYMHACSQESDVEEQVVNQEESLDYEAITSRCYKFISDETNSVVSNVSGEYADGSLDLVTDNMLYVADSVYLKDKLLTVFVDKAGVSYSVIADDSVIRYVDDLSDSFVSSTVLVYDTESAKCLADLVSFFDHTFYGKAKDLPLDKVKRVENSSFYDSLSSSFKASDVVLMFSELGKSRESLGYYDRCLLQFDVDGEIYTLLITLDSSHLAVSLSVL